MAEYNITKEEIKAIKLFRSGKYEGTDGMVSEMIKSRWESAVDL